MSATSNVIRRRPTPPCLIALSTVVLCIVFFITSPRALADEVTIGGMLYSGVKVENFDDRWITFRLPTGKQLFKPVEDLMRIKLDDNDRLNEAEEMLVNEQFDEAMALYNHAVALAKDEWHKKLIQSRLRYARKLKRAKLIAARAAARSRPTTEMASTQPGDQPIPEKKELPNELKGAQQAALSFAKFLERVPLHPQHKPGWNRNTSMQREEAQKEWRGKYDEWAESLKMFIGEKVTWQLICDDISPAPDKRDFVILAHWMRHQDPDEKLTRNMIREFSVRAVVPASKHAALLRIHVNDQVELSGMVKAYRVGSRRHAPDWSEYVREPATIIMDLGPYMSGRIHPRIPGPKKKRGVNFENFRPGQDGFWVGLGNCTIKLIKAATGDEKTRRIDKGRRRRPPRDRNPRDRNPRDRIPRDLGPGDRDLRRPNR